MKSDQCTGASYDSAMHHIDSVVFRLDQAKAVCKIIYIHEENFIWHPRFFSQDFAVNSRSENCTGTGFLTRNMYQNISSIHSHASIGATRNSVRVRPPPQQHNAHAWDSAGEGGTK